MLKSRYMCHTMTIHNTMSLHSHGGSGVGYYHNYAGFTELYKQVALYFITVGERSSGRREVCFHCKTDDVETSSHPVYIVTKGKW